MSDSPTSTPLSAQATQPIPSGMSAVTPHLVCAGASDAIAFYIKAFDAVEMSRLEGPGWQTADYPGKPFCSPFYSIFRHTEFVASLFFA